MNSKRAVVFFLVLLCMYSMSYAQEVEIVESTEEATSEAYFGDKWYYNTFAPKSKGISFFSTGYNYFYKNIDLTITLFDIGITKTFYASTGVTLFFSGLVSIDLGYEFHYPLNVKEYMLMEHIGTVTLGWYPSALAAINQSGVGLMNLYTQKTDKEQSMLHVYKNTSSITAMLVQLPDLLRFDAEARFVYDYAIDYNEHLYEVFLNTPLVQDHSFGQFALKPFVSYTNSVGEVTEIKSQKNLLQHMTFILFPPAFYNFAGGALFEYRFFFLSFLDSYQWYEDFYISATYNVAYIKDEGRDASEVKMYYGAGLGFQLFDAMPFSLQFVMDEDMNMGFSIVSGIIPSY